MKYPIEMPIIASLAVDGKDAIMPIACKGYLSLAKCPLTSILLVWDFKNLCIPRFLDAFRDAPVQSLADIIKFNEDHREKCLPARRLSS